MRIENMMPESQRKKAMHYILEITCGDVDKSSEAANRLMIETEYMKMLVLVGAMGVLSAGILQLEKKVIKFVTEIEKSTKELNNVRV